MIGQVGCKIKKVMPKEHRGGIGVLSGHDAWQARQASSVVSPQAFGCQWRWDGRLFGRDAWQGYNR